MHDTYLSGDGRIAIIGADIRAPGAPDLETFMRIILDGSESLEEVAGPELLADGFITRRPVLADTDRFDPEYFGMPMADAVRMDPQHRHFLMLCRSLLHKAAVDPGSFPNIGVVASCDENQYLRHVLATAADADSAAAFSDFVFSDKDFVATRVSYHLGLTGPAYTVQTACSSSLVAVRQAILSLRAGECDACIAGGVAIQFPQARPIRYVPGMIYSRDGSCRPFDAEADGTNLGSAAAAVLLCRYEDAVQRGDTILAVLCGSAINNDGNRKMSYTAPSSSGQQRAIEAALSPIRDAIDSIAFVETHGTATRLGDPIEFRSLTKAFEAAGATSGACALTGLKANFGHLSCAAGVAGLIKAAVCLQAGVIPRMTNFKTPSPMLRMSGSPFRVLTENEALGAGTHRALVTSFGIGGTNAAVVLETPPVPMTQPENAKRASFSFIRLSDDHLPNLQRNIAAIAARAEAAAQDLGRYAWVGSRLSENGAYRGFVLASQNGEVQSFAAQQPVKSAPEVCLVFPGQGAFPLALMRQLLSDDPVFRDEFLRAQSGFSPKWQKRIADEMAGKMVRQVVSQPLQFAAQVALLALLQKRGVSASSVIGHSIGEFTAMVASGMLTLDQAATLVAVRQDALSEADAGLMLVLGDAGAEDLASAVACGCSIAAINGGGQVTLSGSVAQIGEFKREIAARDPAESGRLVHQLDLNVAYHNESLRPYLAPLREVAKGMRLRAPQIELISTRTGDVLGAEVELDEHLVEQAVSTVRFSRAVQTSLLKGTTHFVEIGRSRLTRWTEEIGAQAISLLDLGSDDASVSLFAGLGKMWAAGLDITLQTSLVGGQEQRRLLPNYSFDLIECWPDIATNARKKAVVPGPEDRTAPPAQAEERENGAVRCLFAKHLKRSEVDATSTFSELGLHSMIAISLCADIGRETGIQIDMSRLMELGSLQRVEAWVAAAQTA